MREQLAGALAHNDDVIRPRSRPLADEGRARLRGAVGEQITQADTRCDFAFLTAPHKAADPYAG
ncbi:hypothetical protein [Streptomyces sp. NPDC001415]